MSDGKKIWYYRTYDEFGKRTTGKSTGQTSKTKAEKYCIQLFKEDSLVPSSSIKLSQYVDQKNFFIYGKCEYSTENGLRKTYVDDCRSRLNKHVLPVFGNLKFEEITSKQIETWQRNLLTNSKKKLTVKTVREIKNVLRIVLNYARSDGYVNADVFARVKKLPQHSRKVRGILTEMEVRDLFDPTNFQKFWEGHIYYYTATLLACFTGMRQGEILALTPEKVFPNHIFVNASWGKNGLGPTKTGETRKVYVKPDVMEALVRIIPEKGKGYIFSFSGNNIPMSGNRLTDNFYDAIERMGIDPETRKERNITFHSFRHWFVTYLRGKGITDAEITSITGQKTATVIDDYTRYDLLENRNIVEALKGFED
jgi:integrase